ncbi:MAG: hypothetical protein A3E31_04120 [Candidatus Rokubacteria bacterium RIFCSPHIGHO2_12_FULL_73_22]|nr:MAG: hypothetical protein A3E31_04120 [Candidatus Rokubacteria bacterium RIFCSPHIGHO2_12_FULL_73_22]OGL02119.1 MAG: hypothetical protein A3D33_10895 [Candidatus Rokubacteria bacterium RIFCSPHIGHO2_02_FULL_73_26]OGL09187.1 MAG: hypothetical protein A3I14_04800 [Candidatus Rokubacteria bacterium RIFCSPLOWO2_02_FULL_73_56]OGL25263.1 MAG: hypothetical protein A3G44_11540 [Candidatus Rokubacteria bacterium RIFCSPLOWO2_12_FULL_73_47]
MLTFKQRHLIIMLRRSSKRLLACRCGGLVEARRLTALPVISRDQAKKKALIKKLRSVETQVRASSRRLRAAADALARLTVQREPWSG